jgi:hypothetical protein
VSLACSPMEGSSSGRLVQDVEGIDQAGAKGVGQGDPLGLAAGEGTGLPIQGEIAESHILQEGEAGIELIRDQLGHLPFDLGERETLKPLVHGVHRASRHRADGVVADPNRERIRVQPAAAALGAGLGQLILTQKYPDVLLVALLLESLQEWEDAQVAALLSIE